jgi:hypothetical protein
MSRSPGLLARATAVAAAAVFVVGAGLVFADNGGDDNIQPVDFTHNGVQDASPVAGSVFGSGSAVKIGKAICTTATSNAANVNTDCEALAGPHNETSIAVNPTDHNNIIGGANDYQLGLNPGGHVTESIDSRAHVSFDGGKTWSMYPIFNNNAYQASGDPAVAFDDAGHAYYATLGFRFVGPANASNPDVVVGNSADGGKNWNSVTVAHGSGVETSVGDLLDKEYVTAWGNGNALVTFGDFRLGNKGAYISGKIYDVVTHDGGRTWTKPKYVGGGLHDSFVSTPTHTSDGRVFASFMNTDDLTTGRDTYYVVELNPTTGALIGSPVAVATVIDGATDYPIFGGRQTYQDSIFRSWAAGNITADPTNPAHLALVFSDMRNSPAPAADLNPYESTTNSDLIVSESTDYGQHWSSPVAVSLAGDQFQSWAAFDGAGTLRIGTFDRSTDPDNHKYDYSLVTQTGPSSFSRSVVSTVQSDPTTGDRWFAGTADANFPFATQFLGDYSGIAVVPGTSHTVAYWTDMRETACFPASTCRSGEDAFFGYGS